MHVYDVSANSLAALRAQSRDLAQASHADQSFAALISNDVEAAATVQASSDADLRRKLAALLLTQSLDAMIPKGGIFGSQELSSDYWRSLLIEKVADSVSGQVGSALGKFEFANLTNAHV